MSRVFDTGSLFSPVVAHAYDASGLLLGEAGNVPAAADCTVPSNAGRGYCIDLPGPGVIDRYTLPEIGAVCSDAHRR